MLIDVVPLLRGKTDVLPFHTDFSANDVSESEDRDMIPLSFPDVTFTSPVMLDGQVKAEPGYMRLSESVSFRYTTHCARCLAPIEGEFHCEVEKTVVTVKESDDSDEDCLTINNNSLDVEAPARDEIFLSFPGRFLCSEDCAGLCSGCGANLNTEKCRCAAKKPDSRFAALTALLEEMPDDEDSTAEN